MFNKDLKKLIATSLIAGSMLFTSTADAEVKIYEGIGEYVGSDFETPDVAKQRAKMYAERDAQEKAGVYVNSYSKTENLELVEDEVIAITNGILSVKSVDYKINPMAESSNFMYIAIIQAEIDTSKVDEWVAKGVNERSNLVAQNKELQKAINEQNNQIAELKKQLAARDNKTDIEKLKLELEKVDNAFMANQKIEAGNRFYFNGDYTSAINNYTEAIELNPNNSIAYRNRGTSYANVEEYQRAIKDFSSLINLEPHNASAYIGRGAAYIYLKEYQSAIKDLTRAIDLEPNNSMAYYNRGICQKALGNINKADSDFATAKRLS